MSLWSWRVAEALRSTWTTTVLLGPGSAGTAVLPEVFTADEKETLRKLAVKAKLGGEKRGLAMVTKDAETADKLMSMYLAAPDASTAKYGSLTGGFSSKPKKGKKNKKKD